MSGPTQKIFRIRRDYNSWVADETLEDYALRYTPRTFRKWSEFRVANTAFGATSFLALEAIGVKEGDGVVVPTMTFAATAEVVRYLGARRPAA